MSSNILIKTNIQRPRRKGNRHCYVLVIDRIIINETNECIHTLISFVTERQERKSVIYHIK